MSYSFTVSGATKEEAASQVDEKMAAVVEGQPEHKADKEMAVATAKAMIDILSDLGPGERISVTVSGHVSWREKGKYTAASLNVGASIVL
jgi:hypothetical protein